ncbi:N-methylhydantoinase B [Hyphomicrobiales bacterium]|nr:N-methylhydantoinase B [Hyphomicrobiales bacterium]CAH1695226.1 N-methylhydantoinase B [Hyphomicrobiales bacterium]
MTSTFTSAQTSQNAAEPVFVDPITVEVLGSAFLSIAEEMGEALVRASYSTNIKERRDCSTALFDADGETLCQAEHIPMHLGSFLGFIPQILARHPVAEIQPGDAFVGNDAYAGGGTHLPDIVIAEPIFYNGILIGWAINTAHHADFADRPHAHIYQEAIRIPPVRLYREGVLQKDLLDLILINCQVPRERVSDLRAQMAANRLGVQRMGELCDRYGLDTVLAAGSALKDYTERRMRAGIAAIPDGVYRFSDQFDCPEVPEPITLGVEITIAGDEMGLRFSAPPQVRASINIVRTALLATVYYAVKAVVDPTVPPNAGIGRPLTVEAPLGSTLNCVEPAAVNGRIQPCQRVVDLIHGALAQAVPERMPAAACGSATAALFSGLRPDGAGDGAGVPWVYLEAIGGGGGARPAKDGLDGIQVHLTNTSNLPVEALEPEYPLTVLRYELARDSGGKGRHRGGMGLRRVYRAEADCRIEVDGSRFRSGPWGLAGGDAGQSTRFLIDGEPAVFTNGAGVLAAGAVLDIVTPGGGGHGPAHERSEADHVRDAADGWFIPAA